MLRLNGRAGRLPTLLHHVDLGAFTSAPYNEHAKLVGERDAIYAVSAFSVVRINPDNYRLHLLVKHLGGEWYGKPHAAADPHRRLYTLSGRNLIQIRPDS